MTSTTQPQRLGRPVSVITHCRPQQKSEPVGHLIV